MNLSFGSMGPHSYASGAQVARVITENWAACNLYCASCQADVLRRTPTNWKAVDFVCDECGENYQLKSGKSMPTTRIVDAAYATMIAAIRGDDAPNLLYLHYGRLTGIHNLLLIPRFFFTEHCIEPRKPLAETARRAGWIGCNIRLDLIAPEGRIPIVRDIEITPKLVVRDQYQRMSGLRTIPPSVRGWALAVLLQVHRLDRRNFSLADIYGAGPALAAQFPNNRNVQPKIRQQLQVLRDLGILEFLGNGQYRLVH